MSPPHRHEYSLAAIGPEIDGFRALVDSGRLDDAYKYFRDNLDLPTLYGLETSLIRSDLLASIEVEQLSNEAEQSYVLYHHALSLNLTGGWPNRAIPLYERQIDIATRLGDVASLSQSLGHYAKALRQVGRFRESEAAAIRGLRIIRERGDRLREAVNLYWLGMGLAHRGEAELSEIALNRSRQIFRKNAAPQAEGVVNAFLAQRALWLGKTSEATEFSDRGIEIAERLEADETHADLHGARKIRIACIRMKGDALASIDATSEADGLLNDALKLSREIEFVEEELPALRALASLAFRNGDANSAREHLAASWHLAERGDFRLYNADSYNILARIELSAGDQAAALAAARQAFELSSCDGLPYVYRHGLEEASKILEELGEQTPDLYKSDSRAEIAIDDIDPLDEYHQNES